MHICLLYASLLLCVCMVCVCMVCVRMVCLLSSRCQLSFLSVTLLFYMPPTLCLCYHYNRLSKLCPARVTIPGSNSHICICLGKMCVCPPLLFLFFLISSVFPFKNLKIAEDSGSSQSQKYFFLFPTL